MENQRLAFCIVEFLKESMKQFKPDQNESLEVACQCISDVFCVNTDTADHSTLSIQPDTLASIFRKYLETAKPVNEATKAEAEKLKVMGNEKLASKDYKEAIRFYTEAIKLDSRNAVFYANRAAAYSQMGDHNSAYEDSLMSVKYDDKYTKGYSRLGLSALALKKYQEAVDAYRKASNLDPTNENLKSSLKGAEEELKNNSSKKGAEGFDLNAMMSNPNFMNMASQMMNSGALGDLLSNPNIANMAQNMFGQNADFSKILGQKPEAKKE